MAEIVYTITRANTESAWFTVNPNTINLFTNDELDVLIESRNVYPNLEGFISSVETFVDDATLKRTVTFDTIENANLAYSKFNDANTVLYQRAQIIRNKMEEIGQPVNVTVVINP